MTDPMILMERAINLLRTSPISDIGKEVALELVLQRIEWEKENLDKKSKDELFPSITSE